MLRRLMVFVFCATLLGAGAPALTGSEDVARLPWEVTRPALTLRSVVDEVQLSFIVEDSHKRLVRGIVPGEISVLEDGREVTTLTSFGANSDLPIQMALLIDCSDSMRRNFVKERQAAQNFVDRLLRPEIDSLLLVEFAGQSSIENVSGNPHLATVKMKTLEAAGHTAVYDAIYEASAAVSLKIEDSQPSRRVMILLSDGEDNDSRHGRAEAVEMAQQAGIVIYAITAHSSRYEYQGDAILRRMAEATGGRAFVLSSFKHVEKIFAQIEAELRAQYSLTFRPLAAEPCGFHGLQVRYRDPKMRVRARQGYYRCER